MELVTGLWAQQGALVSGTRAEPGQAGKAPAATRAAAAAAGSPGGRAEPAASLPHTQTPVSPLHDQHRRPVKLLLSFCRAVVSGTDVRPWEAQECGRLHCTAPHGCSSLPGTCQQPPRQAEVWSSTGDEEEGSDPVRQTGCCLPAHSIFSLHRRTAFCGSGGAEIPGVSRGDRGLLPL